MSELDSQDALLNEILSLGGTSDDLKFFEDISTEEEIVSTSSPITLNLQNELEQYSQSIGLKSRATSSPAVIDDAISYTNTTLRLSRTSLKKQITGSSDAKMGIVNHSNGQLLVKPCSDWYTQASSRLEHKVPQSTVNSLKSHAERLLMAENHTYASVVLTSSQDWSFISKILSSGTLTDKIGALVLMVQKSPLHTMRALESLITMTKKKSRTVAVQSAIALKDLFFSSILPDRKLLPFHISCKNDDPKHLILCAYEGWLKDRYIDFLDIVQGLSADSLAYPRLTMLTILSDLLNAKPEQEATILRILVNKLGDNDKKIASKAVYSILQLENAHPAMKCIIISAIEEILFRDNVSQHSQYYALIALNQTVLKVCDVEVANKLIDIYFALFRIITQKLETFKLPKRSKNKSNKAIKKFKLNANKCKEQQQYFEKTLSALFNGINRAFPFSNVSDHSIKVQLDTIYNIVHSSNLNTNIPALSFVWQVVSLKNIGVNRFYRVLYDSITDFRLNTSSKHSSYLNLLYKALKHDTDCSRIMAFIKRILQFCSFHSPSFTIGVLFLISQLHEKISNLPNLSKKVSQPLNRQYDGRKREPIHSNADAVYFWELLPLSIHFHPTINLFADKLLSDLPIPNKPDLNSYTLSHFLDRFIYKSAKNKLKTRGSSIMQPLSGNTSYLYNIKSTSQVPVNSETFWTQNKDQIPVEEAFFHQYFAEKSYKMSKSHSLNNGDDEICKALVNSRPELNVYSDDEISLTDISMAESESDFESSHIGDENHENHENPLSSVHGIDNCESYYGESDDDFKSVESTTSNSENEYIVGTNRAKVLKSKRKGKLQQLPIFAAVEDYTHLIED